MLMLPTGRLAVQVRPLKMEIQTSRSDFIYVPLSLFVRDKHVDEKRVRVDMTVVTHTHTDPSHNTYSII